MDDSDGTIQSSDVFSDSADLSLTNHTMDIVSYDSLLTNTKLGLRSIQNEMQKTTFSTYFTSLLDDCGTCIAHSLDLVMELLAESSFQVDKLVEYMNDAVCLLQMLSDFIKTVIDSMSMSCCILKTFPIAAGQIIMSVFTHCKDSETIYGKHLSSVEMQLKDLFRTCHELQLTYLMILDKHFMFDLTEKGEQDILIEALDINMKIGEIVQTLDVKTMAEQWKGYTMICEKHSTYLINTNVYQDCTKILCMMAKNNINTAMVNDQQEKIMLRSLKIASFTIKILLKICNIFKHASKKKYEDLLELLLYVHVNSGTYLKNTTEKSTQFTNLMNIYISNPTGCLLKELLLDEKFANILFNYDVETMKKDHGGAGFILLTISVIKIILQKDNDEIDNNYKHMIIECIYRFIPYSYTILNMDHKKTDAKMDDYHLSCGLYQHLLAHTTALAVSMNNEQFNVLERKMLEEILSTNCLCALFSSNLWLLLSRKINRNLLLSQVVSLNKIYLTLGNHKLFPKSPQYVHLSFTISRLFEAMLNEDKMKIYKQFSLHDENNFSLWIALKISNLPDDIQINAEEIITDMLIMQFNKLTNVVINREGVDQLIKIMNLAATCSNITCADVMEDLVVKGWTKACLKNNKFLGKDLHKNTMWYYEYIEALAALTNSIGNIFHERSESLIKVLHVISSIIQLDNTEFKLVLINIICKLATCDIQDETRGKVDSVLVQLFIQLLQDTDHMIRSNLFIALMKNKHDKKIDGLISEIVSEDYSLQEAWSSFSNNYNLSDIHWKEELRLAMDFKYSHKCLEARNIIEFSDSRSVGVLKKACSNFDFADIETLFDNESDTEPECKKVKLSSDTADLIINRLETDVSLLCKVKDNVFTAEYKARLKNVCDTLKNIIN